MPDGASLPHTSAALVPSSLTSISASDVDKSLCDTTLGSMPWGPGTSQFLRREWKSQLLELFQISKNVYRREVSKIKYGVGMYLVMEQKVTALFSM